jgi:saccharopepsin
LYSGTTYAYASEDFCKNLYSAVPGATFSSTLGQWVVPCNQEVNLGLSIGGRRFPIHPLDVISPSLTGTNNSTCYGTFIPQSFSVGAGEFDLLLGDVFLRNVYALFDLGDWEDSQATIMGNPYVKLLSITNGTTASTEYHKLRGGSETEANKISNAQSSSSGSVSSSNVYTSSDTLDHLVRYAEIMLSLLAVTTVLLVAAVCMLVYFVFFKRKRTTPAEPESDSGISAFGLGHLRPPGPAYQQVPSARNSVVP